MAELAQLVGGLPLWLWHPVLPSGSWNQLIFAPSKSRHFSKSDYVPFLSQVLGKSAKPIPVLFLNILIGGKRYPRVKFLIVLLIVAGVALFFYKDGEGTGSDVAHHKFLDLIGFGELLLVSGESHSDYTWLQCTGLRIQETWRLDWSALSIQLKCH